MAIRKSGKILQGKSQVCQPIRQIFLDANLPQITLVLNFVAVPLLGTLRPAHQLNHLTRGIFTRNLGRTSNLAPWSCVQYNWFVGQAGLDRHEFTQLLRSQGKEITADIEFVHDKRLPKEVVVFDNVRVLNPQDYDIVLNGSYDRRLKATKFNFVLRGTGPICRVEVNGFLHGTAGRTHKHDLQHDRDPQKHLPHATPRPDLEGKSPKEIWEDLCRRARIEHSGRFVDPTEESNDGN